MAAIPVRRPPGSSLARKTSHLPGSCGKPPRTSAASAAAFTIRFDEQAAAKAELDALTADQPAAEDPSLLGELPYALEMLPGVPAELRARIYAAFQVHALYRAKQHQATITQAQSSVHD